MMRPTISAAAAAVAAMQISKTKRGAMIAHTRMWPCRTDAHSTTIRDTIARRHSWVTRPTCTSCLNWEGRKAGAVEKARTPGGGWSPSGACGLLSRLSRRCVCTPVIPVLSEVRPGLSMVAEALWIATVAGEPAACRPEVTTTGSSPTQRAMSSCSPKVFRTRSVGLKRLRDAGGRRIKWKANPAKEGSTLALPCRNWGWALTASGAVS